MKIIFVTPYFYPKTGGLENYAYNIAKRLAKTNEVVVITSNHKDKQEIKEKIANLTIYRLPILFTVSHTPVNPFWYFKIKKIIKKENPDIINAHLPVPFIADLVNFIAPKKTIITYHNDLVKSNWVDYICKLYYLLLGNRTLKTSKGIIATSDYYVNKSPYLKKFKSKIAIVSPGVDLNVFNNKIKKGFLKNKNEKIVFVSQLNKTHAHKGLNYLLSSLKEVSKEFPKVHLYVCGKGDYLPRYKELVKKLNIENNVSFLGFVPDEDLPKIYRDVDIAVLPTYSTA
ncbi:glycosyltransferase family 4 protein, partial [archaeon]|nr:glycosyltransferase family 4 protein [archaeon]